jgi:hypothetical protein
MPLLRPVGRILKSRVFLIACVLAIVIPPAAAWASQSTYVGPGASICCYTGYTVRSSSAITTTSTTLARATPSTGARSSSTTTQTERRRTVWVMVRVRATASTQATSAQAAEINAPLGVLRSMGGRLTSRM